MVGLWFSNLWKFTRKNSPQPLVIGVVSFEVASLMSKVVHLWHNLSDKQVSQLREEISSSVGIKKLVSDDEDFVVELMLAEIMENLVFLVSAIARLGKKCKEPILRSFENIFDDLIKNDADFFVWEFTLKKMDRKVKKMEKFITISANLYQELKRFTEVENAVRIAHSSNDPNSRNLKMKAVLQLQEVNNLREISLWNKTYDYVIRLLARSLFTILKRIKHVFGGMNYWRGANTLHRSHSISGLAKSSVHPSTNGVIKFSSGFLGRPTTKSGPILSRKTKRLPSVGPFKGRFASENKSSMLQSFTEESHGHPRPNEVYSGIIRGKHKLLAPPPFALGANGLALHYANVIVEIDKLVQLPHSLTGPRARDNLYNMLPTSIRSSLRTRLKLYSENLVATSYDDPSLAVEWSEALERILEWLAPLADNMTTWQYERSFQQQNLVSRTNVFLVQTLYFADQVKTEAAITELLVGLNYLWRFGREYNEKASLDSGECDGYLMSNG